MSIPFRFSGGCFGASAFNRLIEKIQSTETKESPILLDLSRATSVNAVGLVGLTLFLVWLRRQGYFATLKIPSPNGVYEYLTNNETNLQHLSEELSPKSSLFGKRGNLWVRSEALLNRPIIKPIYSRLISLRRVEDASEFLMGVYSALENSPIFGITFAKAFCEVISELCDNIESHSQSPIGGVAAAEIYVEGDHPRVILALGDLGIGIRKSLNSESDITAVAAALLEGTSSKKEENPGRGGGLARCKKHAEDNGYAFALRSGTAYYLFDGRVREVPDYPGANRTERKPTIQVAAFPGTQAFFGLSLNK